MIVLAVAVCVVAGACGTKVETVAPAEGRPSSPADIERSLARSVPYLANSIRDVDGIPTLMVFDYLSRNWTVPELAGAQAEAADRLAAGGQLSEPALGRLVDPGRPLPEPPPDPAMGQEQLLSVAVYCDVRPLDASFLTAVDAAIAVGGRDATHAALALGWVRELGCDVEGLDDATDHAVDAVASELGRAKGVTDLSIEQAALLDYLGVPDRIPAGWTARVVAAQRSDGGWGETPDATESAWHTTMLATWLLLATDRPGVGAPMLLAAG